MTEITDEFMRQIISSTKNYSIVILKAGPNRDMAGVEKVIWEHARRNFPLHEDGVLSIVCPVNDGSSLSGIGIFDASVSVRSLAELVCFRQSEIANGGRSRGKRRSFCL
jgi:hypothetical protein